jgi:hypothetical protein
VIAEALAIRDNLIPPPWLPQPTAVPDTPLKTKDWLVQEVERRQKLADIPKGITEFLAPTSRANAQGNKSGHCQSCRFGSDP